MAASKSIREVRRGQYVSIASHEWSDSARVGGRSPNDGGPAPLAGWIHGSTLPIPFTQSSRLLTAMPPMIIWAATGFYMVLFLLARFAVENPKYRDALINDPKMVLEKQLGHSLGKISVKSVIETPDTMYVVVPYVAKEGELSDSDLENVAGGLLDNLNATCNISGGLNLLSSNVAIELG